MNLEEQIAKICRIANNSDDLDDLASKILDLVCEFSEINSGLLFVVDEDLLRLESSKGANPSVWAKPAIKIGEGNIGSVAAKGIPRTFTNIQNLPKSDFLENAKFNYACVLPIMNHGNFLGSVVLFSNEKDKFQEKRMDQLSEICDSVGLAFSAFHTHKIYKKHQQKSLHHRLHTETLQTISNSFGFTESLSSTLGKIASLTNSSYSFFIKHNHHSRKAEVISPVFGFDATKAESLKEKFNEKIEQAIFSGKPLVVRNLNQNFSAVKSIALIPAKHHHQTVGVLFLASRNDDNFDHEAVQNLANLSNVFASLVAHNDTNSALVSEQLKSQKIFSGIGDGLLEVDENSHLKSANLEAQRILRLPAEKIIGEPVDKFLRKFKKKNLSISVLPTDEKSAASLIIIHDKTNEQSLAAAHKALSEVVKYELVNPVQGIKGYLDLILSSDCGDVSNEVRAAIEEARSLSEHLLITISDLALANQIEQGNITAKTQKFDLKKIFEEIASNFKSRAEAKKIRIFFEKSAPSMVRGDIEKTKEIITIFIDNAVKYSRRGNIKIRLADVGNFIESAVIDEGVGIAPHHLEKLFAKFSRIITPETKDIPGTGLGLWISKKLVEAQGGKVAVISQKDQGSIFKFTLPKVNAEKS